MELLKNSFGHENETIKNQFLFLTLFDLFKTTLYFVCATGHYQPLFEKYEELGQVSKVDRYPCYLVQTFQLVTFLSSLTCSIDAEDPADRQPESEGGLYQRIHRHSLAPSQGGFQLGRLLVLSEGVLPPVLREIDDSA